MDEGHAARVLGRSRTRHRGWDHVRYGQNDELVPVADSEQAFLSAKNMGLRYDMWVFAPAGHVTEGNNDEYTPAAEFFGENTVDRNPYHVSYLVDPRQDTVSDSPMPGM